MLVKTRGVVLKFIRYKETSIIVNVYTEEQGLQSYIVNGVRSSKSKSNKIALYQPLTLLDLVVYFRDGKQLQRISESKCSHPFYTIPLSPKKSAIALFLVEILSKTLKEQTANQELFDFIWVSILQFDSENIVLENFHLVFIIKLARYLGFYPRNALEIYEELKTILDSDWIYSEEAKLFNDLLLSNYTKTPELNNFQRSSMLSVILSLYKLHIEQFGSVNSIQVLSQVFR